MNLSNIRNTNGELITVPCGSCMPCKVNTAQDWRFRIDSEFKIAESAHFLTFTYADDTITRNDLGHGVLIKKDMQDFFKRLRKSTDTLEKSILAGIGFNEEMRFPKIRYYAVGEYGETTSRPHYHAIVFNVPLEVLKNLRNIWNNGHVYIGTVTAASILYCTKYITKIDTRNMKELELTDPFHIMSKGLGANYVNDQTKEYHSRFQSMMSVNKKYSARLPSYYMNKIHDPEDAARQTKLKQYKQKRKRDAQLYEQEQINDYREMSKDWTAQQHIDYDNEQRSKINHKLNTKKRTAL